MSNDCIIERCGRVLVRCLLAGVNLFFDWLVMRRKESIVRNGRRIQGFLHIPERLQIFAKTDPGMGDEQLRMSSHVLTLTWLLQISSLVGALGCRKVWCLVFLIPGVILPSCVVSTLYPWLVVSRRNLDAIPPRSIEDGSLPNPSDEPSSTKSETERDRPTALDDSREERAGTPQPVLSLVSSPVF